MDEKSLQEITEKIVENMQKTMRQREELLAGLTPEERKLVDDRCAKIVEYLWK